MILLFWPKKAHYETDNRKEYYYDITTCSCFGIHDLIDKSYYNDAYCYGILYNCKAIRESCGSANPELFSRCPWDENHNLMPD